jgi:hypothetical protein
MAPQFGLGKALEVLSPVNVMAVAVGEHLRVQNQAVAITVSEQRGIAPESIRKIVLPRGTFCLIICRSTTRVTLGTGLAYTRPLPLQERKQYEFALRSSSLQMVADFPKAAFINLDFAV